MLLNLQKYFIDIIFGCLRRYKSDWSRDQIQLRFDHVTARFQSPKTPKKRYLIFYISICDQLKILKMSYTVFHAPGCLGDLDRAADL